MPSTMERVWNALQDGPKTHKQLVSAGIDRHDLHDVLPKMEVQNLVHRNVDPYTGKTKNYERNSNMVVPMSISSFPASKTPPFLEGPYRLTRTRRSLAEAPEWIRLTIKGRMAVDIARRLVRDGKRPLRVDEVVERLLWNGLRTINTDA